MTLVFCGGCFDVLHYGHISLLRRARKLGDRLIVGLNTDASVSALKGPGRPVVSYAERYECLIALRYVDEVIPIVDLDPCALLSKLQPDIVVKGPGYSVASMVERLVVNEYGGQIVILDGPAVSTTSIVAPECPGCTKCECCGKWRHEIDLYWFRRTDERPGPGEGRCDHEAAAAPANPGGQVVSAAVSVSGCGHRH